MNPRVKSVVAKADYKLEITFADGVIGVYDCAPLLDWGVFTELRDVAYFNQVRAAGGTVTWPHEQDICPDVLYEDSKKIVVS
jgi:exo-beta-1,3-glucanase (GH17 family)